jgi:hypothetical protein
VDDEPVAAELFRQRFRREASERRRSHSDARGNLVLLFLAVAWISLVTVTHQQPEQRPKAGADGGSMSDAPLSSSLRLPKR